LLHRHYPASSLVRTSPPPPTAQPVPRGLLVGSFDLPSCWVSRVAADLRCAHVLTHTPAIRTQCSLRSLPAPSQPSPCFNRVGVRIALFEACSVFTHIRTCSLADSLARAFDIGSFARRRYQRHASRLLPAERKLPGGILSPTGVLLRVHGALKHWATIVCPSGTIMWPGFAGALLEAHISGIKQAVGPSPAAARSAHRRGQVGRLAGHSPDTRWTLAGHSPDTRRTLAGHSPEIRRSTLDPDRGYYGECPAEPAWGWGWLGEGMVDGLQWVTG